MTKVTLDQLSASTSVATVTRPRLVTPSHGGGRIYHGGVRGHRGGSGRPSDKVRRALMGIAGAGIANVLRPLIEGQPVKVMDRDGSIVEIEPSPADRLRAVEIALKYGLGTANKTNVEAEGAIQVEWEQPEPAILLPNIGCEWTAADMATLDKLQAHDRDGVRPVQVPPECKTTIVTVDV